MENDDTKGLIAVLRAAEHMDPAQVRAAVAAAGALAPDVLARLDAAANGVFPLPDELRLIHNGLHVLAAARQAAAMPAFLRFLTRAAPAADHALGFGIAEVAAEIALSLFDGDTESLTAAATDPEIDAFACWGLLRAVVQLALDGRIPRSAAAATLDRFQRERLHPDDSSAWEGWRGAVLAFGDSAFAGRLLASLEDGRAPPREPDLRYWRERGERLRLGTVTNDDLDSPLRPIDDAAAILALADPADEEIEPQDDTTEADLDDPALGIAPTEAEYEWLEAFIGALPPGHMRPTLGWLDGFLTAVAAGPLALPDETALTRILEPPDGGQGGLPGPAREFAGELIRRHYAAIKLRLAEGHGFDPVYQYGDDRPFQSWSEGFLAFANTDLDAWQPLFEGAALRSFRETVMLAATGESARHRGRPPVDPTAIDPDDIGGDIALGVTDLHELFRGEAPPPRTVPVRTGPKIGRNAPCPCGSGKKYKKCCGKAA